MNGPRVTRRAVVRAGAFGTAGVAMGTATPRAAGQNQSASGGLTDVPGFLVGHATLEEGITGCTVVLCPENTVGGVEIRGGWTGTREMDILSPLSTSPVMHALLLTGGSAFGLAAADGVMRWIEERMPGRDAGLYPVPQVPGAVIYDLAIGDPLVRPTAEDGYRACEAASATFARGSVGAGTGAQVGALVTNARRMKGGLGSASRTFGGAGQIAALAVVNALGNVVDRDGRIVAVDLDRQGRPADAADFARRSPLAGTAVETRGNTTLVAVATNAKLSKTDCAVVAKMAQAGLARAVHPVFSSSDGDVVVVMAAGEQPASVDTAGVLAAEVVADAIRDAVRQATSLGGVPDRNTPGVRAPDEPAWAGD